MSHFGRAGSCFF